MNKWTILITGGTGYIWSHAVVAFEQAWYKTVIIDNLINSSESVLVWINKILGYTPDFYACDIRGKDKLRTIFKQYSFDGVIHFAGLKAVWESCEKPFLYYENNVIGSIHLFEVMEEFWVKNIIFSSSATVYNIPVPFITWLTEDDEIWKTSNPYSNTKHIIEEILVQLSRHSWFRVINLRYFNPIWAHQSWEIWENPNSIPNNLLPYIMKVAIWELETIQIFWNNYSTKDGTWIRDYIDINDLIEWHIKAYQYLQSQDNPIIEIFNLGTWNGVSVLEVITETEYVVNKKLPISIQPRRKWDLPEFYCNPNKAIEKLHWNPRIILRESIQNSYNFYVKKK